MKWLWGMLYNEVTAICVCQVVTGPRSVAGDKKQLETFVHTEYHEQLLADMLQSHMVADFCIIGPRVQGILIA